MEFNFSDILKLCHVFTQFQKDFIFVFGSFFNPSAAMKCLKFKSFVLYLFLFIYLFLYLFFYLLMLALQGNLNVYVTLKLTLWQNLI